MTVVRELQDAHGASYLERAGREIVADYGKPDRTVLAVRNGVGVTEAAYGIVSIAGEDRLDFVDNAVSNAVPRAEGEGVYALLLDPDGAIRTDLYCYHAGDRLLAFLPPGQAEWLADEWREKTFIEDVSFEVATGEYGVFGVHGPTATEKIASVLTGGTPPEDVLTFDRGRFDDAGVTVIRTDAPAGEEGYEVVCSVGDAGTVFDVLLNQGLNAAPVGWRSWQRLTLEAGTPLFDAELAGRLPNVLGVRNALDFEKGCYVGQEVVSRIENRGSPPQRLVGLRLEEALPEAGAAVLDGDEAVGEVTRAVHSPTLDAPIGMALVDGATLEDHEVEVERNEAAEEGKRGAIAAEDGLAVRDGTADRPVAIETLPFHEGSDRSRRLPRYPGET